MGRTCSTQETRSFKLKLKIWLEMEKINHLEVSGIGEKIILRFFLIKVMEDVEWVLLIQGKDGWLICKKDN